MFFLCVWRRRFLSLTAGTRALKTNPHLRKLPSNCAWGQVDKCQCLRIRASVVKFRHQSIAALSSSSSSLQYSNLRRNYCCRWSQFRSELNRFCSGAWSCWFHRRANCCHLFWPTLECNFGIHPKQTVRSNISMRAGFQGMGIMRKTFTRHKLAWSELTSWFMVADLPRIFP